jgi:hypothetical protein
MVAAPSFRLRFFIPPISDRRLEGAEGFAGRKD